LDVVNLKINAAVDRERSPIHTADANATQLSSRVGGVNAPVGSCGPVYYFLGCRAVEVGDM